MMRSLRHALAILAAGVLAALFCPQALADASRAGTDPGVLFDRGAELLAKDPFAAKAPLAKAAAGYEAMLSSPLSQHDRARVLYNIGVARQLGGDLGPAVLAFRRAQLLLPALEGLDEHLAAARAAARGEPAPDVRGHDVDAVALASAWTLSIPRHWLWWSALGAYVVFWMLLLARAIVPDGSRRVSPSLAIASAFVGVVAGALLAEQLHRERAATSEAVVITEASARLQPDDVIGQPSPAGVLKPGMEIAVLEERTGGDGRAWVRVHPLGAPVMPEESAAWIPASSAARIRPSHDRVNG